MLRFFAYLLFIVIALFVCLFAVSNLEDQRLGLSIIYPQGLVLPASVWVLGTFAAGMVAGVIFAWANGGAGRRRHRDLKVRNRQLDKQIKALTKLTAAGGAKEASAVPAPAQNAAAAKPEMKVIEAA